MRLTKISILKKPAKILLLKYAVNRYDGVSNFITCHEKSIDQMKNVN